MQPRACARAGWSIGYGSDGPVAEIFGPAVFEVAQDIDRGIELCGRFLGACKTFRLGGIEFNKLLAELFSFFRQRYLDRALVVFGALLDDVVCLNKLLDIVGSIRADVIAAFNYVSQCYFTPLCLTSALMGQIEEFA